MKACRVAAIQMTSGNDVAANLATAGTLVAKAAAQGASLVLLPENFGLMALHARDKVAARERDPELRELWIGSGRARVTQDF
jgi:nitrilase